MENLQKVKLLLQQLKDTTSKNELQLACSVIKSRIHPESNFINQVYGFEGEIKELSKSEIAGLLTYPEVLEKRNQIRMRMLKFVDMLEEMDLLTQDKLQTEFLITDKDRKANAVQPKQNFSPETSTNTSIGNISGSNNTIIIGKKNRNKQKKNKKKGDSNFCKKFKCEQIFFGATTIMIVALLSYYFFIFKNGFDTEEVKNSISVLKDVNTVEDKKSRILKSTASSFEPSAQAYILNNNYDTIETMPVKEFLKAIVLGDFQNAIPNSANKDSLILYEL